MTGRLIVNNTVGRTVSKVHKVVFETDRQVYKVNPDASIHRRRGLLVCVFFNNASG